MNEDRRQSRGTSHDSTLNRLSAAVTFYRGASLVLLAMVVIEAIVIIVLYAGRGRVATAIRIDGQTVCFVRDVEAADRARQKLLKKAGRDLPGETFIHEKWSQVKWPLNDDDEVLDVDTAVKKLAQHVTVKVKAYAVKKGDKPLVILPEEEDAKTALTILQKHYADMGRGEFISAEIADDDVRVAPMKVQPEQVSTQVQQAAETLWTPTKGRETYTVKSGDTWYAIAQKYDMNLGKLRDLNPNIGDVLHIGDELTVSVPRNPITVMTVNEEAREEKFEAEPQRIKTATLPEGETQVVSGTGSPGRKRIIERVTYHNGREIQREQIDEIVDKEPVPQRIRVGTAEPDSH